MGRSTADSEALTHATAEAVRTWFEARGVRVTVRRSPVSASRYVELRTPPKLGAPDGWPLLTIRVSDHAPAYLRDPASPTLYASPERPPEAKLTAALNEFRARDASG